MRLKEFIRFMFKKKEFIRFMLLSPKKKKNKDIC